MNSYPCGVYSYSLPEGGTARIVAWRGQETELVIPSELDGRPVTEIGAMAFYHCGLEKVTIPDSVKEIGENPFGSCLESVIISSNHPCLAYQDNILYNKITGMLLHFIPKPDMAEYTIPAYITAIGNGAFRGKSSLQRIIIPNSVHSIPSGIKHFSNAGT